MTHPPIRLDDARAQARRLEDEIAEMRALYPDLAPEVLESLLRPSIEELSRVRQAIDVTLGVPATRADAATFWIKVKGGRVGEGRAPASVVGQLLAALQGSVKQAAAYLELGVASVQKIPDFIANEAGIEMVALAPGSARIGIAPSIPQLRTERPRPLAELAIRTVVEVAVWAESEADDDTLNALLPDPIIRRQLLNRVRELAPRTDGDFTEVVLEGRLLGTRPPVKLSVRAHNHARAYLRKNLRAKVEYRGKLIAIDVEHPERTLFDLSYGLKRIHCRFDSPDLRERAKDLLEKYVEVSGIGTFNEAEDTAHLVVAERLRKLTREEQVELTG
jgi:hypothetical protein